MFLTIIVMNLTTTLIIIFATLYGGWTPIQSHIIKHLKNETTPSHEFSDPWVVEQVITSKQQWNPKLIIELKTI